MVSLLLTGFYAIWLYTAYLRPDRYGVLALALTIIGYLPYLDGGFRTVINRAILAAPDTSKRLELFQFAQKLYSFLALIIIACALLAMVIYGLMPGARAERLPLSFFIVLGLANSLLVISNVQSAAFVALQQQSKVFILQTLAAWTSVNALAWAFARGWELWSIPFASIVSVLVTYPLTLRWVHFALPEVKIFSFFTGTDFWTRFHQMKADAWFCFRSQLTSLVLYSADILIIGYFSPKAEVAIYYVIMRLVGMVRSLLQTGGEVGWPFLAQRGVAQEDAIPWFGLHGWIYGSVAGAFLVVSIPFCQWYMGPAWTVSPALLTVIVWRFLVVGLGSSATYLLYAAGQFRPISKCLEGELFAGLLFGILGGYFYGTIGVATGFLIATAAGTLIPVFIAYSRAGRVPVGRILGTIWTRALLAYAASYLTATLLLRVLSNGFYMPLIGSAAVMVSLLLAIAFAVSRNGFHFNFESRQLRQILRKI
jgi:O-antigen/teichoic acid export membrane protein